jgi:hypothetical protein
MIALLVLANAVQAGERIECEMQPVTSDTREWHYRTKIDGREDKCWYPGERMKPRSELYWGRSTAPTNTGQPEEADQPQPPLSAVPPQEEVMPNKPGDRSAVGRAEDNEKPVPMTIIMAPVRALIADDLLAKTCCWPEHEIIPLPRPRPKPGISPPMIGVGIAAASLGSSALFLILRRLIYGRFR